MKSKGSLTTRLVLISIIAGTLHANANPPFQVSFTQGSGNTWNADWASTFSNRTFFAQSSVDLVNWEMLPVLEFGTGLKGTGIDTGGETKFFFRLKYIDADWVTSEEEARNADFDNDGIPNAFEVEEVGSDPLDKNSAGGDADGDGLPDGWEQFYFDGTNIANPNEALQPDGLTNKEKADLGLSPNVDYSDPAATQKAKFVYDFVGRLTEVTAPIGAGTYAPDEEGNLLNAN